MTRQACEGAGLVEALFDGRLGTAERASTERHLKTCAVCSELLSDLSALHGSLRASVSEPSQLEHQRARLALLRRVATPSAPAARKRRATPVFVAALLALPVAVWAATSAQSPLRSWFLTTRVAQPSAVKAPPRLERAPAEPAPSVEPATRPLEAPSPHAEPATPSHALPTAAARASVSSLAVASAAVPAPATSSQASLDFAAAMASLSRGDFSASAGQLARFAANHPRDPRVEEAVYLQAIALERAGRVIEAQAAARRYLAVYPAGAHSSQARRIAGE